MSVTAVIAVAMSLCPAAEPPADRRGPELQFELAGGTVITGRIDAREFSIRIASGNVLSIPVAALKELTVGLNDRPGLVERVETLVKALDSARTREDARRGLIALGPGIAPIVKRHSATDVSARLVAVTQILTAYKTWSADHPHAPEAMIRPLELRSKVRTGHNAFLGTVTVKQFRIAGPYGNVTVKLDDVRRIRRAAPATANKFRRWTIELRDKTRLKGVATGQSLRIQTHYGTIVVPFRHIQEAIFAADRKAIHVHCLNSDRIVGAIRPETTISLKTDEGRVKLSAGKITVVAREPFTLNLGKGVTMKLVRIPAGKFTMSSPKTETGRDKKDEDMQRRVTISKSFYMGVTEVTQAQWQVVMDMRRRTWPPATRPASRPTSRPVWRPARVPATRPGSRPTSRPVWRPTRFPATRPTSRPASRPRADQSPPRTGPDYALSWASWDDATAFCRVLSMKIGRRVRLPTEAEWEYACRAGTTTVYSFGDDPSKLGDYAWYRSNAYEKNEKYAHLVGRRKPNAWGLYDMHGNVWEWCSDWYGYPYASADVRDPKGAPSGRRRILRSGAWDRTPRFCRAATRGWGYPGFRGKVNGFRVVVESGSSAK